MDSLPTTHTEERIALSILFHFDRSVSPIRLVYRVSFCHLHSSSDSIRGTASCTARRLSSLYRVLRCTRRQLISLPTHYQHLRKYSSQPSESSNRLCVRTSVVRNQESLRDSRTGATFVRLTVSLSCVSLYWIHAKTIVFGRPNFAAYLHSTTE